MPHYAYVETTLRCPFCNTPVSDVVTFQWGFSPGQLLQEKYLYHIGDPIYWRRCADGSIRPWIYFETGEKGANIGDPSIMNLIVCDAVQFYWTHPSQRRRCHVCQHVLEGAALEIRDGVIARAWIYEPGEFDNEVDIYLIEHDGTLKPMPEWNDHPMDSVLWC
jgi:hypothetical protein